ncbi:hypothetical protein NP493_159g00034 [Ridgeia piscesae]|uniref:Uncharacterized protein n=1 Tax=Ridgeia piscesae TaxID=27915 RepID=A0AAD9P3R8_RIDPI|nr:hypothetical protein NP493_159g00034 [Ridgeia piscesae]
MVFLEPPPDIVIIAPPPKPPWLDYTYTWNGTHMLKVPDNGGETSAITTGGHSMVATYVILAIVGTLVVVLLLLGLLLWYKKKHMIGNKVSPSERSSAFTHQTPPLHAALTAVGSSTKKQRRRSSTSSGISVCQSDDSTKPFVTFPGPHTRPANAVYPPLVLTGFPTAPVQGRSRQTVSCVAPSEPDTDIEHQLPDLVQLQRTPNKAALLPIERRLKPPDNSKRKTARKRRRKQQSSAGTSPVDGASCLDTFVPLRVATNPTADTEVSESYA